MYIYYIHWYSDSTYIYVYIIHYSLSSFSKVPKLCSRSHFTKNPGSWSRPRLLRRFLAQDKPTFLEWSISHISTSMKSIDMVKHGIWGIQCLTRSKIVFDKCEVKHWRLGLTCCMYLFIIYLLLFWFLLYCIYIPSGNLT